MKIKLLFGIMTGLAIAAGIWFWIHGRSPVAPGTAGAPAGPPTAASRTQREVVKSAHSSGSAPGEAVVIAADLVQTIVDLQQGYLERTEALHHLPTDPAQLSTADHEALRRYLAEKNDHDSQRLGQAFKNELMNAVCEFDPPPTWVGETLAGIYRDGNQDPVIRDYAVQHAVEFYEQMELAKMDEPDSRRMVQEILWAALKETDGSIAGTALLGLMRLSRERPEAFDSKQVSAAAVQLFNDKQAGELSRITAIQVCAQMGARTVLPLVLDTAQNGDSLPLRISAVNALGMLGDDQQRSFLTNLVNGTEERLVLPAQSALDQINRREQQAARINQRKR